MATLPPEILANIAGRRLNITSQRDKGLQDLSNQYNQNLSNLDEYSSDATRRINDQYASQGIANSGIRVDEQGRMQKNVGQKRSQFALGYGQGQSGIQSQYENALQALNEYQNEQMLGQTRTDLNTQLQQQQIAAQNAANAQAASMGGGGGGAPAGPSQADIDLWNATQLWNATIAWNDAIERNYRGAGNALGYQGATFR